MSEVKQIKPGERIDDLVEPASTDEPSPPQPFVCAVSADLFLRAWQGRSQDKDRKLLAGVYIEPCDEGGAILTATDGHILISIRDPNALVKGSAIVTLNELLIKACKGKKSDIDVAERVLLVRSDGVALPEAIIALVFHAEPFESRDAAMIHFTEPNDMLLAHQVGDVIFHGDYPKWRGILPEFNRHGHGVSGACFDLKVAKALGAALTAPGGKQSPMSWFTFGKDPLHAPILVKPFPFDLRQGGDHFDGFAIVMPHKNEIGSDLPEWADRDAA
jgi:hypothetical protein